MKNPSLTDAIRRAYEAAEFYTLSPSDKILLVYGIIRAWNDRRRPQSFACKQEALLYFSGLKLTSLKNAREKLVELGLISWEEGERNVKAANYSLGDFFYRDHEPDHEPDHEGDHKEDHEGDRRSDREGDPIYRGRDREKEREENPPSTPPRGRRDKRPSALDLIKSVPNDFPDDLRPIAEDFAKARQSYIPASKRFGTTGAFVQQCKRMKLYPVHVVAEAVDAAIAGEWKSWEQESIKGKQIGKAYVDNAFSEGRF